jgi:hypothetical protein
MKELLVMKHVGLCAQKTGVRGIRLRRQLPMLRSVEWKRMLPGLLGRVEGYESMRVFSVKADNTLNH